MKEKKIDLWNVMTQVVLWSLMWCIPFVSIMLNGGTWDNMLSCLKDTHFTYLSWMLLFYLNYFLLIPRYLFRHKTWHYFFANFLLILFLQNATHYYLQLLDVHMPTFDTGTRVATSLGGAVMNIFLVLASISLKVQERNSRLEVEAATRELDRLKSQLNPHFLFNTLNNISSLVSIDPDAAQTSISRLSDMLRYVLYDSTRPTVPLRDEVKFLSDYIDLMRLRYADTLQIDTRYETPDTNFEVPPLLYISLVENAFKHGASSRHPCFIRISLTEEEGWLCFTVSNSLLRDDERPSGQSLGVGLKNLEQRLRLIYKEVGHPYPTPSKQGFYSLHTEKLADAFHAQLKIRI